MHFLASFAAADALKGGSLEAGPLGEVARQLNGSNELWLALALAAPGTSELQPPQLAALACGLVAADVRAAALPAAAVANTHCTLPIGDHTPWLYGDASRRCICRGSCGCTSGSAASP